MATSALDVATRLDSAIGALTLGTNLFTGTVRPADNSVFPVKCVFCIATSGPAPDDIIANTFSDWYPAVQIRIRSDKDDYAGGITLARQCRDAIHHYVPAGYIDTRVLESEPNYLGQDRAGYHEWSVNVEMWITE